MSSELQMQSTLDEEPEPYRSLQRDVSNISDASLPPLVAARHPSSPQPASPYNSNTDCELSSYREDPMMNQVILDLVSSKSEEEDASEEFGTSTRTTSTSMHRAPAQTRKLPSVIHQDAKVAIKRPPTSHMSSTDNTNKDRELKQRAKAMHKTRLKTMTSNVPKQAKVPEGEQELQQQTSQILSQASQQQDHEDDEDDGFELQDLMSSAVQSHSNAILALVARGSDRSSFSSSIPPASMPPASTTDSRSEKQAALAAADQPSRLLAAPTPQRAKKEKRDPAQTSPVSRDTSSVAAAASPPEFARDRRLQPEPGAVRVCGYDGNSDDDEMDSGSFSVTDPSTYCRTEMTDNSTTTVVHHLPETSSHQPSSSGDLIQAVLVEDGEEKKREDALAEREAVLRQRELELERKLQQMTMTAAVQAEVVSSPSAPEKKKKGLFGRFKFGKGGSSHKPHSETEVLTKSPSSRADPPQSPLPPVAPLKDLVRQISTSGIGSVDISSREDGSVSTEGSVLSHLSSNFHRSPSFSLPFLQYDEVQVGNVLSQGTFNEVRVLKMLNLRGNWNVTSHYRESFTSSDTERQVDARKDLSSRWLLKQSKYVVKTVRPDLRTKKQLQGEVLLRAEANLLSYLSHEHIVESAAMDESGLAATDAVSVPSTGGFFVVVEQVMDTLYDRLTKTWPRKMKGPQFFAERIQFSVDIASALSYMHSMNVIYCDLKPESVGFDAKGNLKLFNFGGATVLKNATQPYDQRCETFHVYTGTHPYVAPEVALHRKSGINLDTYAFSILLWEMITLKEPFADLMVHEYAEKVIQRGRRPKLDKKYPDAINQVIDQCWQANPKRRPRMDEVHGVLLSEVNVIARQGAPKRAGFFK